MTASVRKQKCKHGRQLQVITHFLFTDITRGFVETTHETLRLEKNEVLYG
jgi:hypothetical protein